MTDAQTADLANIADTQSTALAPVSERAALALNSTATEAHLVELATKHAAIAVIKDKAGRDQAHGAAMELKRARTQIERVSKDARDDATKFSKAVIAEEKRLIGIIEAEESRLFQIRDEWDAEQERIRQEKIALEQARVEGINDLISGIATIPAALANSDSGAIAQRIEDLTRVEIWEDVYQEFTPKAEHVKAEVLQQLSSLLESTINRELAAKVLAEEQARLAAEREELDRQRRELEQAKALAAAEAAVAAQRMLDEANAKARREAEQREAFEKQQRDAFEAEKAAAQELLAAEQRALAEERARIAAQVEAQRKAEEAARREREEAERQARKQEELTILDEVVSCLQASYGCTAAEAEDLILRASATITARNNTPEFA